jgi:cell division protein FtsB
MKFPRITGTNIVNVLGAAAVVYLVVVLGETVHRNYQLGHQIDELNAQINLLEAQKQELAYTIQYYQTDSFHERDARAKLGLQKPGEGVVIIPGDSPGPQPAPAAGDAKAAAHHSNWQLWFDFLAGRL